MAYPHGTGLAGHALLGAGRLITARNVAKSFGRAAVLRDVTLEVAPGECLALLGANGAGKTTFLKMAATLVRPTGGSLSVLGLDVIHDADSIRGQIGLVGHGSHVYEDLTALENLRFWNTLSGRQADGRTLRAALETVELHAVADQRVRTFSAGMKRRLSLARFVDARLRLLLLDEPSGGLDQQGKKWLGEFLLAFKAGGGAVLMATHDLGRTLEVADRVAILAGGTVAADRPCRGLDREQLRALYDLHTEAA